MELLLTLTHLPGRFLPEESLGKVRQVSSQMASRAGQFSVSFLDLLLLAGNMMRNSSGQQTLITSPEEQQAANRLK